VSYLDTSFIVPLYLREATSERVEAFLRTEPPGSLVVSRWVKVEFASTLARNVRMKLQLARNARMLMQHFDEDTQATFQLYTPSAADFTLAKELLLEAPMLGLRGADALHLAAAKTQRLHLYTLDQPLLRAAEALGVSASDAGIGAS